MYKFSKIIILTILTTGISIGLFLLLLSEDLPKGKEGKYAEIMAQKILHAINKNAYDSTNFISWDFRDKHYEWNKSKNIATITWKTNEVQLHLDNIRASKILLYEKKLTENEKNKLIKKCVDYFNNDSFWVIAPFKLYDPGTKRSLVKYEGKDALLITYTSGGSTPGDSYLWIVDENFIPTKFKMWVSIIPIGGLEATWDGWKQTATSALLPTRHSLPLGLSLDLNTKTYNESSN